MNWLVIGLGGWIILDGLVSIKLYVKQSLTEQAIRVIRCGVGAVLIYLGYYKL